MKITGTNRDSECMYCAQKGYGKGCPYGPQNLHVHADDPTRCVWCGQKVLGAGCPYNPHSNMHQRGIAYNPVMIEALENGIIQGIVMKRLSEPITEQQAYKLGLIDKKGNIIKQPETIEEKNAMGGCEKYLIKVKNLMKEKLELLNLSLYYESTEEDSLEDIEKIYPHELQCRDEVMKCISELSSLASEYYSKGISPTKFEKIILEAIVNEKKI